MANCVLKGTVIYTNSYAVKDKVPNAACCKGKPHVLTTVAKFQSLKYFESERYVCMFTIYVYIYFIGMLNIYTFL